MTSRYRRSRLSAVAVAAAKPRKKEYTLWDGTLSHFGLRVQPSGVRSFIVQTRAQGRMRKITLGRFPEMGLEKARREGASVLARLWGGETVVSPRKAMAPSFRDFAARYRERRKHRWKPSSLETHDIYMRGRLMPTFGRMRLDAITHARVSAWFDAASADRPGAANRAFEILRAMLRTARQWGELGEHVPDACANIVKNPRSPVARYLDNAELARLGAVLDKHREEHPWSVAAIRLLTLTGARLSEILNLRWDETACFPKMAPAPASKTPRPVRAPSGSDRKPPGCSRHFREPMVRCGYSPRTSPPPGSTPSGSASGRKLGCPAFVSMTAATHGLRRASWVRPPVLPQDR